MTLTEFLQKAATLEKEQPETYAELLKGLDQILSELDHNLQVLKNESEGK